MAARSIAVVLAGAVAKGAFEAGALGVLLEKNVVVKRVVAASSGALNGTCLAVGIRGGDGARAVRLLRSMWEQHGGVSDAFHFSLRDAAGLRGLADQDNLLKLLRENVKPAAGEPRVPIELDIVVSPLDGRTDHIGRTDAYAATTFEYAAAFRNQDFDSTEALEKVFRAAVASSSFPGAFAPMKLEGIGPCVDGGTVNNTPLQYALHGIPVDRDDDDDNDAPTDVDAVVVISPTPVLYQPPAEPLRGLDLVAHLADMLINERLFRDLKQAAEVNETLARLRTELPDPQYEATLRALRWSGRKRVDIVPIRPREPLMGNAFSGFGSAEIRRHYLTSGENAARASLDGLNW